ncbi:FAD:protein FMN transferase [Piscinibacter sp. XHJ-5]|uniref:FAD:protein FMN transferase n=1 Tax=Piscinibacter sp. XHJ-5 TaxID=3037797 RepID=UPI002452E73F|nr:FAD:protein FMN transferase [Piscinibacter sp. XHJ-5]
MPHDIAPVAFAVAGRVHEVGGVTMGTTWSVKLVADGEASLPPLERDIQRCLDGVDAQMSTWKVDSDLSRFNRAPAGSWNEMPADCFGVLAFALRVAEQSGGAYDPTAGALVDAWGFGPPRRHADAGFALPAPSQLAEARACTGWQRIEMDPRGRRALQPGGVRVDLSAVAKGFAVDKVAQLLSAGGVSNHLVEVGGELRGTGVRPDGLPWWVALEAPLPHRGGGAVAIDTMVALHGLSVATSGDYRRGFTHDGQHFCHTIDPRTGRPITHGLASVSVVHRDCMAADAQSTALTVMGLGEGLAHARRHRLAALFVQRTAGGFEEHLSDALAELL